MTTLLVAPFVDVVPYTYGFARRLGFGERIRAGMVRRSERRFGVPMSHLELTGMARQMTPPPVLVVHDRDDRETMSSGSRDLSRAWPDARLLTTSGLGPPPYPVGPHGRRRGHAVRARRQRRAPRLLTARRLVTAA